jgi:hypothetical protein
MIQQLNTTHSASVGDMAWHKPLNQIYEVRGQESLFQGMQDMAETGKEQSGMRAGETCPSNAVVIWVHSKIMMGISEQSKLTTKGGGRKNSTVKLL